jgi:hypothetical protein
MTRQLEITYNVLLTRRIGPDNQPMSYWTVWRGHSPRDYAAEDYRPFSQVETFRTEAEARGFIAYNRDCDRHPTYHDGTARPVWSALRDWARDTWIRNPTILEDTQ